MISNEEKEGRHYLVVKKTVYITKRNIYHGDFYCSNCLNSFRTENKLQSHEKVCKNKYFRRILLPSEKDNL